MDILLDYELDHSRRPRVLVQTAGHVAGAVRYYQRSDIVKDPWPSKKVCLCVCVSLTEREKASEHLKK